MRELGKLVLFRNVQVKICEPSLLQIQGSPRNLGGQKSNLFNLKNLIKAQKMQKTYKKYYSVELRSI